MKHWSNEELHLLTEVLPNIAQELKSSMATLYAAADRLVPAEERGNEGAAAAFLQSYYRMHRVVGNLDEARRLADDGPLPLKNDDIAGLCAAVCTRAEELFALQGVTLAYESDRESCIIAMNAPLLERLLLNLLSNALKFTPRGGSVRVQLRCAGRTVLLRVADTGCGIAPEKLESVFDRFLEPQHFDPPPHGVGLGLALCRRIAQGHGGSIVAESAAGKGAVFTVSLPNERTQNVTLSSPVLPYPDTGFDRTLLELSDALSAEAFADLRFD